MSEVEPLVFLAGVNRFGYPDPSWNLVGEPSETGARMCSFSIRFERSFRGTPIVHLGLNGFDISNQDAARLRVRAERVTSDGFEVVAETWLCSQVWSIEVSWLAIGS